MIEFVAADGVAAAGVAVVAAAGAAASVAAVVEVDAVTRMMKRSLRLSSLHSSSSSWIMVTGVDSRQHRKPWCCMARVRSCGTGRGHKTTMLVKGMWSMRWLL